jgi:hypothetical protein
LCIDVINNGYLCVTEEPPGCTWTAEPNADAQGNFN